VTDELLQHWALHEIDEEAARHEIERAKLPDRRRAIETTVDAERRRLEALDKRVAEAVKTRRGLERDIEAFEAQERKYRTQLDAVTNQHQFEAVQHEIAGVVGKRSALETRVLTLMESEEQAAAERPTLAHKLENAERDAQAALAKVAAEDASHAERLAALALSRNEVEARMDAPARSRVQRIRASRGGRAVAAILKHACGGCFRVLPPQMQQEARKRDRLLTCEGCGRLIMLPPEGHPEA
jgi:predicted  nucleic acid-binding Zn-ribbon protein